MPVTRRTPEGEFHSAVPLHKEVKTGTMYGILRDLHIAPRDFANYV